MSASIEFFIQFCHQTLLAVFGCTAFTSVRYHLAQDLEILIFVLEQAQAGAHNLRRRTATAFCKLSSNELVKMLSQADTRILSHRSHLVVPIITKLYDKLVTMHSTQTPNFGQVGVALETKSCD